MHLQDLWLFHQTKTNWYQLIGAGCCMLTVLLAGFFLHDMAFASFASLGIFTFLYYQPLPKKQQLQRLSLIGAALLMGHLLGMLATHWQWAVPLVVGMIAFLSRLLFRLAEIRKPGPFFIVMVTAMGSSTQIPLSQLPATSLAVAFGILIAIGVACCLPSSTQVLPAFSFKEQLNHDPAALLDALFYGAILFFAVYLSQSFHLHNPYWLTVSCAAILQGDNLRHMLARNNQRIFGTTIGLIIAALLLSLPLPTIVMILMITLFFVTVEFFVKRNYAVANFFSTPMALMLAMLAKQQYLYSLVQYRFLGIVLGSLLGLLAAWLMTTVLRFYNRAFHLHETFEQDSD